MSVPAELTCIGDISVDTLVSIDHLPRRDEKQWAKLIGDFPGGMSANVAVTYARLGGSVALVARVGRDTRGATSLEHLQRTAVDISRVNEVDDPTFWTMSLIDAAGERSMVEFASEAIHPPWESAAAGPFGKIAYTIDSETSSAIEPFRQFQARGMITAVDADYAEIQGESQLKRLLRVTTVFFCNSATARRLTRQRSATVAARALSRLGPRTVVVTLGRLGAVAVDKEEGVARVRGQDVEVLDSTGAGDCFAGAFLFARVRVWPLKASLELANVMAAQSTTAYGCQSAVPTRGELLALPASREMSYTRLLER